MLPAILRFWHGVRCGYAGRLIPVWAALAVLAALACPVSAVAQSKDGLLDAAPDAATLRSRHAALLAQLARNDFGRPLVLESEQIDNRVEGVAYAVLNAPFAAVSQTFSTPQDWCGIMLLHLNTRRCQVRQVPPEGQTPALLMIEIGKKVSLATIESLGETFSLDLRFEPLLRQPDFFSTRLSAGRGPVGTRDYRILLEAIPLTAGQTFVHFRYAYGYGLTARLAMQVYLGTFGSRKIGFSMVKTGPNQPPRPVTGLRGAVERNTIRYFLAMEVYLQTRELPEPERQDRRLRNWFDATEQYHAQLYEIDRDTYLTVKKQDFQAHSP